MNYLFEFWNYVSSISLLNELRNRYSDIISEYEELRLKREHENITNKKQIEELSFKCKEI